MYQSNVVNFCFTTTNEAFLQVSEANIIFAVCMYDKPQIANAIFDCKIDLIEMITDDELTLAIIYSAEISFLFPTLVKHF